MLLGMAGLYDGEFRGYRIASDADLTEALNEAVVAVDANVLLSLYRLAPSSSSDLIRVLESLGERLVVPHQAVREFWRNRLKVMSGPGPATRDAGNAVTAAERKIADGLVAWSKQVGLGTGELETWLDEVTGFADDLRDRLSTHAPERDGVDDQILAKLEALLDGRVTAPLSDEEWDECVAEGARRVEAQEPPGYMDAEKDTTTNRPEGTAGDYLVWFQATRAAKDANRDLVIVTADEKEDWWWKHRSAFLGPRAELSIEFHALADHRLFFMRPKQLWERAAALDVEIAAESLAEASRAFSPVSEASASPTQAAWTADALQALFEALNETAPDRVEVILAAAEAGGRVSREQIYAITQRGDNETLRAFTRPTERLTRVLQAEGIIPEGVPRILEPEYPDGVRASYFRVPDEVAAIVTAERDQERVNSMER